MARNVVRYSEGKAFDVAGASFHVHDNEFAYNGWNSLDTAHTMRISGSAPPIVEYNTFRQNGQVSAFFAATPGSQMRYNRIQNQNIGELQHDGEAIGAGSDGTRNTVFEYNWVDYGHHSLTLRYDCSQTAKFSDVSDQGTMRFNVGKGKWGSSQTKPKLIVKGEDHNITYNTIIDGEIHVVREFGCCLCGMNNGSSFTHLLAGSYKPRGATRTHPHDMNCDMFDQDVFTGVAHQNGYYSVGTRSHVLPWPSGHASFLDATAMLARRSESAANTLHKDSQDKGFPNGVTDNARVANGDKSTWDGGNYRDPEEKIKPFSSVSGGMCEYLRDCDNLDFRPRAAWPGNSWYGAYQYFKGVDSVGNPTAFDTYFIPGRRLDGPEPFIVSSDKNAGAGKDLSIMYHVLHAVPPLAGRGCTEHVVRLHDQLRRRSSHQFKNPLLDRPT